MREPKLNASEALYGFMGWLTSRKEKVEFGANCDASPAVNLIEAFRQANGLNEPNQVIRDDYAKDLIHPD